MLAVGLCFAALCRVPAVVSLCLGPLRWASAVSLCRGPLVIIWEVDYKFKQNDAKKGKTAILCKIKPFFGY